MSNEFKIPAKPWGDAEIKQLMAHKDELDEDTRAEIGLDAAPKTEPDTVITTGIPGYEARKPEEGPVSENPSEESTETVDETPETTTEEIEVQVEQPKTEATVETETKVDGEETVDKVDEDKA